MTAAYVPAGESAEGLAHWQKTYPNLTESDWVLAADAEDSGANRAFSRAAYALVQAAGASAMDPAALAALDQSDIDEAVNTAAVTPDSLLGQTGAVLVKRFCQTLGADTDAIQTGYILSVGVRMLGLTLLLTACAISAGFCLSRLGAGVGRDLRRDVFTGSPISITRRWTSSPPPADHPFHQRHHPGAELFERGPADALLCAHHGAWAA